jgi:hypothetical protein
LNLLPYLAVFTLYLLQAIVLWSLSLSLSLSLSHTHTHTHTHIYTPLLSIYSQYFIALLKQMWGNNEVFAFVMSVEDKDILQSGGALM